MLLQPIIGCCLAIIIVFSESHLGFGASLFLLHIWQIKNPQDTILWVNLVIFHNGYSADKPQQ